MIDLTQLPGAKGFDFPTDTVLIAVGPATLEFINAVEKAVLDAEIQRTPEAISQKESRGGRYVSVHVPIHVQSREELERAYRTINSVPGLRFRL